MIAVHATSSGLEPELRDEYKGKTLLIRGFHPQDELAYDVRGNLIGESASGDWTADGFVTIEDIHISGARLIVDARRLIIVSIGHVFQFAVAEQPTPDKRGKQPVHLQVTIDFGQESPSAEQVHEVISKIFFTPDDDFTESIPDYWKPCVTGGLAGKSSECLFSKDILAVPGVGSPTRSTTSTIVNESLSDVQHLGPIFRVGGGVTPPGVILRLDPEFSERAPQARFQGTVTLLLIVDKQGIPTNVHIAKPLGYGLDERAVRAVRGWRFKPSEKDGYPVSVEIAVEVQFHLY